MIRLLLFVPECTTSCVQSRVHACVHISRRGLLYSPKKGTSRDLLAWLQQPIDLSFSNIQRWLKKKELDMIVDDHKFLSDRHNTLGPDLATAHFVVARDGAVKFKGSNHWVTKRKDGTYSLPSLNISNMKLEAVDLSQTNVVYRSFDNFIDLSELRYLNLSRCKYIDDWCLDRLVAPLRATLLVLDLSGCSQVSERGLASLHRLRSLRRLIVNDMTNVKHLALTSVMLQQVLPDCVIESNNDLSHHESVQDKEQEQPMEEDIPAFIRHYMAAAQQSRL